MEKHILFICLLVTSAAPGQVTSHNTDKDRVSENGLPLTVSTNFEGGSAQVLAIDSQEQRIRITPAGDPKRGMPVWWYLRIDHLDTSKVMTLEVVPSDAIIPTDIPGKAKKLSPEWTWPAQAAYSVNGKTWIHTPPGEKQQTHMVYRIKPDSSTLWIAWGPPFTPADAQRFVQQLAQRAPFAAEFTLSHSREGRPVPAVHIREGQRAAASRPALWIHARQHAWEVGGSWVATGFAEWLISDDEQAVWLRKNAEIFIVPLMDVDHVATGDGGKHALPQDHNLDWTDSPHWPEIAAVQTKILALAREERMSIFLDLHNPSPGNKIQTAYVIEKEYMPENAEPRKQRFVELMMEAFGELKQIAAKPPAEDPRVFHRVSVPWVLEHSNANTIAFCIETPWNAPTSTIGGYRVVGKKLGQAVEKLLHEESALSGLKDR
jgi:hypothetical protein